MSLAISKLSNHINPFNPTDGLGSMLNELKKALYIQQGNFLKMGIR